MFTLPPLPYAEHALAPYLLPQTLSVHYGHHHRDAVQHLNTLVQGTALADMSLEDVIRTTAGDPRRVDIFNNAAQAWNHMFYWRSMRPGGGGVPAGDPGTTDRRGILRLYSFQADCADDSRNDPVWEWLGVAGRGPWHTQSARDERCGDSVRATARYHC